MKKKVALLLALVMVLAMIPMSAFGSARPGTLLNPQVNPATNQSFVVRIDAAAFSGLNADVVNNAVLDFQFSNPNARGFSATPTVTFSAGPDFAVSSPAAMEVSDAIDALNSLDAPQRVSSSRVLVDLFTGSWAAGTWVLDGFVDVRIDTISANPGETLTVYLRTGGDGVEVREVRLLAPATLAGQWNNGVTITAGTPTNIGMFAVLPAIRITENNIGRLVPVDGSNHSFMVRMVAPRGFRWSTTLADMTGQGQSLRVNTSSGLSAGSIALHTAPVIDGGTPGYLPINQVTQRSEIYLNVTGLTRGSGFLNQTTNQWVEIIGLSLIPVEGAATVGTVGIDVYVGSGTGDDWGAGVFAMPVNPMIDAARPANSPDRNDDPARTDNRTRALGSFWAEYNNNDGNAHWRVRNLPVVNLTRIVGNLTVQGPADINTINSGSWQLGTTWLNGNYHTLQIIENSPGVLFSNLDQFEIRPVNPGVRIIDFETRVRRGDNTNVGTYLGGGTWSDANWGDLDALTPPLVIPVLTNYVDGALQFAPMHDRNEWEPAAHRVELRLALSVEAGYEARFGQEIYVEVLRNGASIGIAHIANARDLITIEQGAPVVMYREAFDVIGPETASSFTIVEREAGILAAQNELHFSLQSFRDGNPINLGQWNLIPHVGIPTTNEAASGMLLTPGTGTGLEAVTVLRQSVDNPGRIIFNDVMVSGPVVPNVDWHVLVFGPQVAPNSSLWVYRNNNVPTGDLTGTAITPLTLRQQRGIFYYLPYNATILSVIGESDVELIEGPGPAPAPEPTPEPTPDPAPAPAPRTVVFTTGQMAHGAPILEVRGGVTNIMARAFMDEFGGTISHSAGVVTAVGTHAVSGQTVTVVMTIGSDSATINGQTVHIPTFVGQPGITSQTFVEGGRTYVHGRFLAYALGHQFNSLPGGAGVIFNRD